jgi:2-dehydropantoate 2-reductase
MRILMVGAGGLGGYYGARLLAAGRDVTFLVRPATAEQLAAKGLRMTSPAGDVTIEQPQTVLAGNLQEHFDLVILTCKARDLDSAIDSLAPAMGPDSMVLPLLNGMAHMARLDARFGRARVLGGSCFISTTRGADGVVRHLGEPDRLVFGDRDDPAGERIEQVAKAMCGAGFDAGLVPDIEQAMWEKWCFIAASAGSTCLMRAAIGDLVAAGVEGIALRLFAENGSIAAAYGHPMGEEIVGRVNTMFHQKGSLFMASMLRDLEAGAPIEAQQIVGDLLELGRAKAIATPVLEIVFAHLRCYEERRKRQLGST